MKTVVEPKLLSSYMLETMAAPQMGAPISVPILCLPGVDDDDHHSDAGSVQMEDGAAGMLQVSETGFPLYNC